MDDVNAAHVGTVERGVFAGEGNKSMNTAPEEYEPPNAARLDEESDDRDESEVQTIGHALADEIEVVELVEHAEKRVPESVPELDKSGGSRTGLAVPSANDGT